ncbi:MAG: DUF2953 domain-containing protein [Angelakisella sp.]
MIGWMILAVVLLLLCWPVGLELESQNGDSTVTLRLWSVIPLQLWPQKPKKPKKPKKAGHEKKAKQGKRKKAERPSSPKKPMTTGELLELIDDLLPEIGRLFGRLLRALTVSCTLRLTVFQEDAAETALQCGKLNGVLYSIYVLLAGMVRLREYDVAVQPCFFEQPSQRYLRLRVSTLPPVLLGGVILFLLRGGRLLLKHK